MAAAKRLIRARTFTSTLIAFGILGSSIASASDPQCYDLASLQGNYAVVTHYGDNVAMTLGVRYYDGKGNFTGNFLINQPTVGSNTGERTLVAGAQAGTYTVNCDGTGVTTRIATALDGTTATQADDFLITDATVIANPLGQFFPGHLIATAVMDAGRVPSPLVSSGLFVTHKYTRLPDRQQAGPSKVGSGNFGIGP